MAATDNPVSASPVLPAARDADRERQLVEAAYELLEEEGLEGLTIRAVLKRTGLARRAFYERFAGKDDLVLAVFEQTLMKAADHFRAQGSELLDPVERIRVIVTGVVLGRLSIDDGGRYAHGRGSAAMSREHLRLAESRPAELQAALSPLLGLIAEQVAAGIASGEFRPCDPALQARLIYNLVSTTVHTELLSSEGGEIDQCAQRDLADAIWEFCRRAIIA